MAQITRRNFLEAAGAAGVLGALAACDTKPAEEQTTDSGSTAAPASEPASDEPAADEPAEEESNHIIHDEADYPIDPDGSDVEALWTTETMHDGWIKVTQDGRTLGVMDEAKIIQVDGYAFKDLNGNGKLDLYEDWRQDANDRAIALANMMDPEEITKYLVHDGITFSEELPEATIEALEKGQRGGVTRGNATRDTYSTNITKHNTVQQWCEENDPWGITYLISTDPYQVNDLPDPHTITSAMDMDIARKSGMWIGRWWNAWGVRLDLGPQVDIGTNAVWTRLGGSLCEDPALNRDIARAFCDGMQSTWADNDATEDLGWGEDSVACMFKHYVGPGATEGGRNDHAQTGKYCIFPEDNFEAHLIPFLDGGLHLEGKTKEMAAIMTNYGCHWYGGNGEATEEEYKKTVGGAYNHEHMSCIRSAGWDGFITTDYGIFWDENRPYGVEDLTLGQRYEQLYLGTVDTLGGTFDPEAALDGYHILVEDKGQEYADKLIRECFRRMIKCHINTQMLENPYSDAVKAKSIIMDQDFVDFARECSEKCIVMLKNKGNIIKEGGIEGKPKCYIPKKASGGDVSFWMGGGGGGAATEPELIIPEDTVADVFDIVTDTVTKDDEGNYSTETLTVDELKAQDVEYVVLKIEGPSTGDGVEGAGMDAMQGGKVEGVSYKPISLQYGAYSAPEARDPSYAGDMNEDGSIENRTYKGVTVEASNLSDIERINEIHDALPDAKIILIIEAGNNAQCFYEFEDACDVILWSWSMGGRNFGAIYGDMFAGKVEPTGLLPCQMPADMDNVETSAEDVPRDLDCHVDSEGNTYDFCFGLNWDGVIDDDRVAKYSVAPLTKPETEFDYDSIPPEL